MKHQLELQVLNEELRMGTASSASYYQWCARWLGMQTEPTSVLSVSFLYFTM